MKRKHKKLLLRICAAISMFAIVCVVTALIKISLPLKIAIFLVPYLTAGYDVILKAMTNIRYGRVFDENFLMCIATVGAFVIAEYPEAVFVMIFYQIGELFQSVAVGKSRKAISSLVEIQPKEARVIRNGAETVIDPDEVGIGETLVVRAGEKIPLDGIVTEGETEVNCMALTGESLPRELSVGMKAISGSVNLTGTVKIEVTSKYEDSTVARILDLVENATASKSKTDRFITRFARVYTPAVVIGALLLFLIPSLITGAFSEWLGRALIFLVISCPCALVISVPLSYFGGLGAASRRGILIKGASYLEALADAEIAAFDKTGTLTKGHFAVCQAFTLGNSGEELMSISASVEESSNHPIAKAVYLYCLKELKESKFVKAADIKEHSGMGVTASVNGVAVAAGNAKLMKALGVEVTTVKTSGSVIYVCKDKELIGYFTVKDEIKPSSVEAINALGKQGVKKKVMLTGDREESATEIAKGLGLDGYYPSLMPKDKLERLEALLAEKSKGRTLIYAGDGINDAPVLTRADVGIAMGAMGADAAIEAADVVLMDDDPMKIADAVRIAKSTKRVVIENIAFALGVKLFFMVLGAFGVANLWEAVFADVGVSVVAILNAMRTLKLK